MNQLPLRLESHDVPVQALPPANPDTPPCQCEGEGFCNRYARQMVGKRYETCSEKFVVFRSQSPEVCKAYRSKWDKDAEPVLDLLKSDAKVYLADLEAIGGQDECTTREVQKLGISGDPGITLAELHKSHPEVAARAAKWIAAGRPKPSEQVEPIGLGDAIHHALAFVGITPEFVESWVGAPCGCPERREKLNQLGEWATSAVASGKEKALGFLSRLIGKS